MIQRIFHKTVLKILTASMLAMLISPTTMAADSRQYKMEAAYLHNFFHYITWPGYESPEELITPVICVNERDPVVPYLRYLQEKKSDNRLIKLHLYKKANALDDCHILFTRNLVDHLSFPSHTLRVFSDPSDYLRSEEMIELQRDGNRMAIRINNSLLEQQGFKVSSRLLSLAEGIQ